MCAGRKSRRGIVRTKGAATTEGDPTQSPSFDEKKRDPAIPFTWIKMAKGMRLSGIRSDGKAGTRKILD